MTEQTQSLVITGNQPGKLKEYIRSEEIMLRFKEVLGDYQASAYVSSVILAVANSQQLQECTPLSIVSSALRAASLRLSCDPSTGQAYLVPFKDRGVPKATLIVGYKGLYHMALRTNKYRDINVAEVYEGEEVSEDRITGMHKLEGRRTGDKVIGYIGYFELLAGYRKTVYMTVSEIHEHAQRRSKGYNRPDGAWKTDTAMMEKKTVLRLMLSHWGYFDPHDTMMLDALDAENDGVEILPETVTVVDEPRHDLEELLPLWDNQPQPQTAPLRVDKPAPEAASVKSSNTTDAPATANVSQPTNGNGHEAAPVYTGNNLAKFGKNKYPAPWCSLLAAYKRANQFEVDGILQKLALPQDTRPEQVVDAINKYLDAKSANTVQGRDAQEAA